MLISQYFAVSLISVDPGVACRSVDTHFLPFPASQMCWSDGASKGAGQTTFSVNDIR